MDDVEIATGIWVGLCHEHLERRITSVRERVARGQHPL